jgi:hypothetical protein
MTIIESYLDYLYSKIIETSEYPISRPKSTEEDEEEEGKIKKLSWSKGVKKNVT